MDEFGRREREKEKEGRSVGKEIHFSNTLVVTLKYPPTTHNIE